MLKQGSEEWLKWRKTKITASDLPIIMGRSKWCTPYELWKRKVGFLPDQTETPAMRRGTDLEPVVRRMINDPLPVEQQFVPTVVQHPELDWAAASLDGLNSQGVVLEIKCPNLADHRSAEDGKVPDHYWDQVQWQLFCASCTEGLYVSYYRDDMIATVNVKRDDVFLAEQLLPKAAEFYRHMVDMTPPPQEDVNVVEIVDPHFEEIARHYKASNENYKFYEAQRKYYHDKLIDMTDDGDCYGYGLQIKRVRPKDKTDYKKLMDYLVKRDPSIKEIDMTPFVKESIGYWMITERTEK